MEESAGFKNHMVRRRLLVLPFFLVALTTLGHAQSIDLGEARHLEETEGEGKVWILAGPADWLTDRGELDSPIGLQLNVGYGYEVGDARLAWHINVVEDIAGGQSRFVSLDLVSLERVYRVVGMQAYTRIALSVGTDVRVEGSKFGQKGFYNSENSATGGFGLRVGTGLDLPVSDAFFFRVDAGCALFGGVGRMAVPWSVTLGPGLTL